MTTQNPAQGAVTSSGAERVEPDCPLSGEVKRGGASKPFITSRIERHPRWRCALVTVEKCWFESEGPIKRLILQQYETASRGAAASARKAVAKARAAL